MNGVCRVCGESGHLYLTSPNVCRNCIVEIPREQSSWNCNVLIEKQCRNCAHLVKGKPWQGRDWYTCDMSRFDEPSLSANIPGENPGPHHYYALSGFKRPNKAVAKAQKKCPYFEVHPKWRRHED